MRLCSWEGQQHQGSGGCGCGGGMRLAVQPGGAAVPRRLQRQWPSCRMQGAGVRASRAGPRLLK